MRACGLCGKAIARGRRCASCKRGEPPVRYGPDHRRRRKALEPLVAQGKVRCSRGAACRRAELVGGRMLGGFIAVGEAWHLDHRDDGVGYLGPAHADCNASAGAAKREGRG